MRSCLLTTVRGVCWPSWEYSRCFAADKQGPRKKGKAFMYAWPRGDAAIVHETVTSCYQE
jgi:hypothetical protein